MNRGPKHGGVCRVQKVLSETYLTWTPNHRTFKSKGKFTEGIHVHQLMVLTLLTDDSLGKKASEDDEAREQNHQSLMKSIFTHNFFFSFHRVTMIITTVCYRTI